jgi:hypothetical protein
MLPSNDYFLWTCCLITPPRQHSGHPLTWLKSCNSCRSGRKRQARLATRPYSISSRSGTPWRPRFAKSCLAHDLSSTSWSWITACRASSNAAVSCQHACLPRNCSRAGSGTILLCNSHCRSRNSHTEGDPSIGLPRSIARCSIPHENSS